MENKIEKLTTKQLEKLTKQEAFAYAIKLGFKNVPYIVTLKIKFLTENLLQYARDLDFKNVPKLVIDLLSSDSYSCMRYIEEIDFKNIPKKMIYKLSYAGDDAYRYAKKLKFKKVPKIITDRIAMYTYYSWEYTKNILINKNLPLTEIESIKLPQNILNTVKNSGIYNEQVLKKGNIFTFEFADELIPGKNYVVNVNKCPDELNKEIMEKVFEEENPHIWHNIFTDFANFFPFDFTVNNKKYLCVCEYMWLYEYIDVVITEYTEPKIQSFNIKEIKRIFLERSRLNSIFFEHCAKIITDNKSERVSHWIKELWLYCGWIQYDRIKPDNKPISYDLMRQYFFGGWGHNYDFFKRDLYEAYTEIKKVKPEIQDKSNDRLAFVKFKIFLRKTMQMLSKQQLTEEKLTNLAKQYLI